ncbi:DUF7281 domain-containing protein [Oceanospirillum multiglobuliferum]|uniref:DUF7281 domain-containing protein n=1 Tax=Oceanospirillum multiglobuliferum TaxID=64969 RepID=UPI0013564593|nr:Wadjet anti-phage system protein JetD domain-containing protein [Oceanospirillum multiglobuliferum]
MKTSTISAQEVLRWCILENLIAGNSLNLPDFLITKNLLNSIAQIQKERKHRCFRQDLKGVSRTEQALLSDQEDKGQGLKPRSNRVLVRLYKTNEMLLGCYLNTVDVDWQQLDLTCCSRLIIVENLDCFYQLECFQLNIMPDDLVVYRGDKLYGHGVKSLKRECIRRNKPTLYFGDFDPKGMNIALSEGYQGVFLPSLIELDANASAAMLPDEQVCFLHKLEALSLSNCWLNKPNRIMPYLQVLKQHRGLRQQRMQNMALEVIEI